MDRKSVLLGGLSVAAAALLKPSLTPAAGARAGPWCKQLTKFATENVYDFELYLLDGDDKTFSLSAQYGHPVWLNFFTSWCPPCNDEMPEILAIERTYRDAGLRVVGIDVGEADKKVRAFKKKFEVPYPIALDSEESVFHALGLRGFPSHMFVDRSGLITCLADGSMTRQEMDNEISVALARPLIPLRERSASTTAEPSPTPSPAVTPLPY